jgi:WD40 repeat protein
VALTADGKRAVSGSDDNTVRVSDLERNQVQRILQGHTGEVYAVGVMPDGKHAVTGSQDKTIRVWDLGRGHDIVRFTCDAPVGPCTCTGGIVVAADEGGNLHVLAWEE